MPTIKQEMGAIDRRKFAWYDSLSDDEKKSLSMWVLMRYCSSVSSKVDEINHHYLGMTNELVNVHFNTLRHHPELQFRLMQIVGVGTDQFHPWIKPGKKKKDKSANPKLFGLIEQQRPDYSDDEIELLIKLMDKEETIALLTDFGIPDKKHKEYLK
jgi:hypothetical protein